MIKINRAGTKGLTLVEMIIAMAVVAVVMASVAFTVNIIMESWFSGYRKTDLEQQARAALRQMEKELKEATNFYGFNNVAWNSIAPAGRYLNYSQMLFSTDINKDGNDEYILYYLIKQDGTDAGDWCDFPTWCTPGYTRPFILYRAEVDAYDDVLGGDPPLEAKEVCRFVDRSDRTEGTKFEYTDGEARIILSLWKNKEKISLKTAVKPRNPSNINVYQNLPWLQLTSGAEYHWYAEDNYSGSTSLARGQNNLTEARYGRYTITSKNLMNFNITTSPTGLIPYDGATGTIAGLVIRGGQTLVIHGGVTVLFDPGTGFYVQAGGTLRIDATETNKVVFKANSDNPSRNFWVGVKNDGGTIDATDSGAGQNLAIQDAEQETISGGD